MSILKVVSFEIDLTGSWAEIRRLSWPRARCHSRSPMEPKRATRSLRSQRSKSAKVRMPAFSREPCITFPTPQIILTGLSRRKSSVSALPIMEKPRGLFKSDATLARNLLWLRPIEPLRPNSSRIRLISRASITAGGAPCRRAVPVRSINASSKDNGSMAGVSSSIIRWMARDAST